MALNESSELFKPLPAQLAFPALKELSGQVGLI
jgi:hypothetical protein